MNKPFWKKVADMNCQYAWSKYLRQQDSMCLQCKMLHTTAIKHKKRKTHEEKVSNYFIFYLHVFFYYLYSL